MSKKFLTIYAALALVALTGACLLGGCGSDSATGTSGENAAAFRLPAPANPPLLTEGEVDAALGRDGLMGPKPEIEVPDAPPPEQLEIAELRRGKGYFALENRLVTVQYSAALYDSGKELISSWEEGRPFSFKLGAGKTIEGWEEGIAAMAIGGRRELVVPPDAGYGSRRVGSIPPNSTLVFVVDLLDVYDRPKGAADCSDGAVPPCLQPAG